MNREDKSPPAPDSSALHRPSEGLTAEWATALAEQILSAVHREYPNKLGHVLLDGSDARTPRELTPAFCGAFDWHSSVHGHWALSRLLRLSGPMALESEWPARAAVALSQALTADNMAGELSYARSRRGFEIPYGGAWLLLLGAELSVSHHPEAARWAMTMRPLVTDVKARFIDWADRLSHPVRTGEHNQSAFALGIALDAARTVGDANLEALVLHRASDLHGGDAALPLHLEPSAFDFLSPSLAAAELMGRTLGEAEFATWLDRALPRLGREQPLEPLTASDPADGKLVHFDGLNLSRAWMLRSVALSLPANDSRVSRLTACAQTHGMAGLAAAITPHFAGNHWLGTFALYWLTCHRSFNFPQGRTALAH